MVAKITFSPTLHPGALESFTTNQKTISHLELDKTWDVIMDRSRISMVWWYFWELGSGSINMLNNHAFLRRLVKKHENEEYQVFLQEIKGTKMKSTKYFYTQEIKGLAPNEDVKMAECTAFYSRFMHSILPISVRVLELVAKNAVLQESLCKSIVSYKSLDVSNVIKKVIKQYPPFEKVPLIQIDNPKKSVLLDLKAILSSSSRSQAQDSIDAAFGRRAFQCPAKHLAMEFMVTFVSALIKHYSFDFDGTHFVVSCR